jgi:hypothetical protein
MRASYLETIEELAGAPDEFARAFRKFPAELLRWRPDAWDAIPGEMFSAQEQACHLRDIETEGYHHRFDRLLREEGPELASIDGYALARERRYGEQDALEALAAFRCARAKTVELLAGLAERDWRRRGSFAEYGAVTTAGLTHVLRSHDQQHLACMHWLLAKAEAR